MKLLVTGGAGFIGSAFVRMSLAEGDRVVNLDKLTYAGNLENLECVASCPLYRFVHADICDAAAVDALLAEERPEALVHFAAESHVDRSIWAPSPVFETNLRGTFTLLEAARARRVPRFVHVSTDEVYGSLEPPFEADEGFPLNPSSPYSASKAGSDLLARSYFVTYRLPVMVTRASNNYGPCQFPEKLVPLMISNAMEGKNLPVYSDGLQVRDWLHVDDHCRGIRAVLEKGREGEIYNIGGNRSLANLDVVRKILASFSAQSRRRRARRSARGSFSSLLRAAWSFAAAASRASSWIGFICSPAAIAGVRAASSASGRRSLGSSGGMGIPNQRFSSGYRVLRCDGPMLLHSPGPGKLPNPWASSRRSGTP